MTRHELDRLWDSYGCRACVHFRGDTGSCAAFPTLIPLPVVSKQVSHVDPIEGDGGIRFEPIEGVDSVHTLNPAKADDDGRINFGEKATRTFVSGLVERLKARFGLTYRDKPDA